MLASEIEITEVWFGRVFVPRTDAVIGQSFRTYGEFARCEADLLSQISNHRPGALLDVGANIGAISVPWALQHKDKSVYAFEPQMRIYQILCANSLLNSAGNIQTFPYAVGDKLGLARFPQPSLAAAQNFGAISWDSKDAKLPIVQIRLDELRGNFGDVGIIKIDVEGFELAVLNGAEQLIGDQRPAIYFEAKQNQNTLRVIDWLRVRGYMLFWHYAPFVTPLAPKATPTASTIMGDWNILAWPASDCPIRDLPVVTDNWDDRPLGIKDLPYMRAYGYFK